MEGTIIIVIGALRFPIHKVFILSINFHLSFFTLPFFFFFEFEVYCPLFTQQDIVVLREHYIGDPGSI